MFLLKFIKDFPPIWGVYNRGKSKLAGKNPKLLLYRPKARF